MLHLLEATPKIWGEIIMSVISQGVIIQFRGGFQEHFRVIFIENSIFPAGISTLTQNHISCVFPKCEIQTQCAQAIPYKKFMFI